MKTYAKFSPTAFDTHIEVEDRENWLVAPVMITRDSNPFAESNFYSTLGALGGEGENVEVHRFGHWGPGWFEIIIVRPGSPQQATAEDIERGLEDYPVVDDSDLSERELAAGQDYWDNMSLRERVEILGEHKESIFAARCDCLGELNERAPNTCYRLEQNPYL